MAFHGWCPPSWFRLAIFSIAGIQFPSISCFSPPIVPSKLGKRFLCAIHSIILLPKSGNISGRVKPAATCRVNEGDGQEQPHWKSITLYHINLPALASDVCQQLLIGVSNIAQPRIRRLPGSHY